MASAPPPDSTAHDPRDPGWAWNLLERLGIGALRVDNTSLTIARANEALARMYGVPSAEAMVGRAVLSTYTDPKERAEAVARLGSSPQFAEKGFVRFEAQRVRIDDGTPFDVLLSLVVDHDAEGKISTIDGLVEKIDDRRGADKVFGAGEERFRVLFEDVAVGLALASPEGRIHRTNAALQRFLGLSAEALVQRSLSDLALDDDRTAAAALFRAPPPIGSRAADEQPTEAIELRFRRSDGSVAWGALTASWLVEGGVAHTRVVSVQDITRRKHMEEALLVHQKLDAVGRLAAGIAHDFNNILTVIQGNLALAGDDPTLNADTRDLLSRSTRSVRRAQELAQQLITFADGGCPLKRTLSLADLVREVSASTVPGSAVHFEIDEASDLLLSDGDAGQLAQAFHHLFLNAVEAMPGGGSIRVRLRNEVVAEGANPSLAAGTYVRVDVEDSGVGIPEHLLEHVVDPYFSTKRAGGGLGLPIVLSIVRRHGGHAEIRSRVGLGTVVSLLLPAADTRSVESPPAEPTPVAKTRPRLLIMDDDVDLLDLERRILTRADLDVATTTRGEDAVDACARALSEGRPFAALVLDLTVVGGMGGLEALGRIRALDPTTRSVVCSGYCRDPVMADHRAYGFDGMVPKPFTPDLLRDEVLRVLQLRSDGA